jgi:hypothetical protein
MKKLPNEIQNHFRHFFFGEESTENFTKWLYNYSELEKAIGSEKYMSLLEINYRQRDDLYKAKQIVENIYDHDRPDQLFIDQVISIAEEMLKGSIALDDGCRRLAHISADGHNFVDSVFVAYADEFDRLGATDFYNERIIDDVKKLLSCNQ